MKKFSLSEFKGGWIVGDFLPAIIKTDIFEVAIKNYKKGEAENAHVHKIAKEITVVISGSVVMANHHLEQGDILILDPFDCSEFYAKTDATVCVIKMPSIPTDKYLVKGSENA